MLCVQNVRKILKYHSNRMERDPFFAKIVLEKTGPKEIIGINLRIYP
jgi:hypothetical protein